MHHYTSPGRRWIVLLALLACILPAGAQERDTQLWTEFGLTIPLVKRTNIKIGEEIRLDNDLSSFRMNRTTVELEQKVLSFLEISAAYRITLKPDELEHSAHANATFKVDVGPLELAWRLRLLRDFFPDEKPRDELRNRFTIEFEDSPPVKPYISSEVYYSMRDERSAFDKFRWYMGLKRDIGKKQRMEVYYLFQREIGKKSTEVDTIFGVGYSISL
jgi:hypothetical protein